MDLVAVFLILIVGSVRSTGNKNKNSNKVHFSANIANNPFLQPVASPSVALPSVASPSVQGNLFLQSDNKNGNPFLSNSFVPQEEHKEPDIVFPDNPSIAFPNNPFLNPFGIRVNIESSPRPVTRKPYRPPPDTPAPYRPPPPTPAPPTHTPTKIQPPSSPSLQELIKLIPVRSRSQLKCDEYAGEIAGTTEITPLSGTSTGVIKVNNLCQNANRLVIGGIEAQSGEFPHMVAVGRRSSDTFILMCGGSLISHTWVLSAAHCTYGPNGSPTDAHIGFHKLTDQQAGVMAVIKNMIKHEDYKPPAMYADIALMQLENAVTFSVSIRPACLYQPYHSVPKNAWISGWGVTEYAGDQSDRLQKAKLDLIDNVLCAQRHGTSMAVPHGVTPSMICAGDPRGNWTRDSCQGDSGGPLQIIHTTNDCLFQVIGITSFGQGCAMGDTPGVYTRVSHYLQWIEDNVWPQGQ